MFTAKALLLTGVLPSLSVLPLWVFIMLALRRTNFTPGGSRKTERHEKDETVRTKVIEYHNNATYRAFEFYIKVLLAVFGGIAFVVIQKYPLSQQTKMLVDAGGWVVAAVTFLFSILIVVHQKSKVERWQSRYRWYEPLLWNECWFVAFAVALSFFTRMTLIPEMMK